MAKMRLETRGEHGGDHEGDERERVEVGAPKRSDQLLQAGGKRHFARPMRKPIDKGGNTPMQGMRRQQVEDMVRRRAAAAGNPYYLDDDEMGIPKPPDDADWHYHWARAYLRGRMDSRNINTVIHGRLPYTYVRPDDLDDEWRGRMQDFVGHDGAHAGCYMFDSDLVLMRCPRRDYELYMQAIDLRADDMVMGVRSDFQSALERRGFGATFEVEVEQEISV